ncbi:hypothetical protein H740_05040 [Campylobacter showae CC57C]|uniref:Uncharacterized protein n=1 Tax=Campylobacter showae CC57C TaxID=1073353 RepID=M3JDE5_9BACT|nr:hypothetical protein H740_05040 [Campylobacter showae CC57C]
MDCFLSKKQNKKLTYNHSELLRKYVRKFKYLLKTAYLVQLFSINTLGAKAWVKGAASSPCEPLRKPKTVTFCGHVEYARPINPIKNKLT